MGENDIEVIEVSSASSCDDKKKVKKVFGSNSSSPGSESGTPIGHILCLKNSDDVKRFEETEDCFILDFDPFQPIDLSKLIVSAAVDDGYAPDLAIVAETGQVACRDYPHSRHLCAKFPFEATSHESHCDMCYCYVCDTPAPCLSWTEPKPAHCHASEHKEDWKSQRHMQRKQPVFHS
ncbi:hypothetical protein L484_002596 [Morus notabilis]|uniref:Uncharacterized protein n=1 Tax=Morus notabilis TaxID=981085 RepID=W9S982_9ROSA|nr:uncharacterized protein LOC21386164 [Morus notabilis]EXB94709.1 hypothetical protein L484_002596 [Morus notabilis]